MPAGDSPAPAAASERDPTRRTPPRRHSRRRRSGFALLALVLGVGTAVFAHRVGDVLHGPPVEGLLPDSVAGDLPDATDPRLAELSALLAGSEIGPGHDVEIVVDAPAFARMEADLRAARTSITLLLYYCEPGSLVDRWAELLAERARAGVEVLVVGDDFGCGDVVDAWAGTLGPEDVRVARLRPLRWYSLHRDHHRSHGRSLVVDGRVGWTGGFGLSDLWTGTADEPAWRETNVRFTGPAVGRLQALFAAAWAEATGRLLAGTSFYPSSVLRTVAESDSAAGTLAGVLASGPGIGTRPAERHLALAIVSSRRTLFVTNSYFVPPRGVRSLLIDAARRGVDVRILVAGTRTDVPSALWAARAIYDELLAAGVRIWEYQPAMMHAKTLVVDGTWTLVGSLNLDNRSLRLNEESALMVHDAATGATMDALFLADLEHAREWTLEALRARPLLERLRDRMVWLVAPLL